MLSCEKTFLVFAFMKIIFCSGYELKINRNDDSGPGEPLFLTPLLESGKVDEARKLAFVKPLTTGIESYTGYFTVNKNYNSNIFFWFFKSDNNWKKAPVTIWLQGGPGATGLFGLFLELGPYILKNGSFYQRYHSWHKDSNLIFVDSPVGSGFSFTDSEEGYAKNQTAVGESLYNVLKQFFTLFPNLVNNKFFIAGESYAGKFVPTLGYTVHKYNSLPDNNFKINLQGLLIGNGITDPFNMMHHGDYLYELGLIDFNELNVFHDCENKIREHIVNEEWRQASKSAGGLIFGQFLYPGSTHFNNVTGLYGPHNYVLNIPVSNGPIGHTEFINSTFFRKIIHVGDKPFLPRSLVVSMNFYDDFMKSVLPWVVELLDHYRIVFYNGQLDIIVAYTLTENFLKNMKWKYSIEYSKAKRQKWKVDKNIAGYFKIVGNLMEVLVRNAGHSVPTDQPLWSRILFRKFITNSSLTECDSAL